MRDKTEWRNYIMQNNNEEVLTLAGQIIEHCHKNAYLTSCPSETTKSFISNQEVLVRDEIWQKWQLATFQSILNDENMSYMTSLGQFKYCIPYNGNEELLNTYYYLPK